MLLNEDAHVARIQDAVAAGLGKEDARWRTQSWGRCLTDYRLDAAKMELVNLSRHETSIEVERFDNDLSIAQSQLERMLQIIEGGGYSAHIANSLGIIIEERRSKDETYYCAVDQIGSVWSEEIGGTNGIGLALFGEKPAAVYLSDHFFAEITNQACAAAPFFKHDGTVLGVINLSTRNPSLPRLAHRVIFGIAQSAAEELEMRYFQRHFRRESIFHFTSREPGRTPVILAVDDDFRIVGASREARQHFDLNDATIGKIDLWSLFEKLRGVTSLAEMPDMPHELRPLGHRGTMSVTVYQPIHPRSQRARLIAVPPVRATTKKKPVETAETTLADCAGNDPDMKESVRLLKRVFNTRLNILLLGETGVGKDTLAKALHFESDRAGGPYVAFNCAAVPESLIDSELFGYAGGAFTGANKSGNSGRIVDAHRGTLFLDEIGDMPVTLQTRLLRFLETREIVPLGSGKAQSVDVQVVAATHQDLLQRVADGRFREDLYYRLTGLAVELPALRERDDILEIAENILHAEAGDAAPRLSEDACEKLILHDWPGNIRELRNVLIRALQFADGPHITGDDILIQTMRPRNCPAADEVEAHGTTLTEGERREIVDAIKQSCGDASRCAECLGITRAALYRKLKKHKLSLEES